MIIYYLVMQDAPSKWDAIAHTLHHIYHSCHGLQAVQRLVEAWKNRKHNESAVDEREEDIYVSGDADTRLSGDSDIEEDNSKVMNTADGPKQFISHVPVPTQQEVEEAIVRRKKMELLQKYASDALRAEAEEAKTLLGL